MSLEQMTLTLNPGEASERQYEISMIEEVAPTTRKDAFSISPPGRPPSENILLGVSGMQEDVSVSWMIHDDGTDKANGTHSSTVVTVDEQVEYLRTTMHDPSFGAEWALNWDTGTGFSNVEVFVEEIAPTLISQQSPKWKPATMRVRLGGSVG